MTLCRRLALQCLSPRQQPYCHRSSAFAVVTAMVRRMTSNSSSGNVNDDAGETTATAAATAAAAAAVIPPAMRGGSISDCARLLVTKKAIEFDYVAVDMTSIVSVAYRLAKNLIGVRRNSEVARYTLSGLQQLLRVVYCRRGLLLAFDGAESLAKAHTTRRSGLTRRVESRLARLPASAQMQVVEERLLRSLPDRHILASEVTVSGTCVAGCVESKMTAWALDLACRDGFASNNDTLCLVGPNELYLLTLALTPYYNVRSVVQSGPELRQVHLADVLDWLGLAAHAGAGASTLVARVRTDVLLLHLLCHGSGCSELGACQGLSFAHLFRVYHRRLFATPSEAQQPPQQQQQPSSSCDDDNDANDDGAATTITTAAAASADDSGAAAATVHVNANAHLLRDAPGHALALDVLQLRHLLQAATSSSLTQSVGRSGGGGGEAKGVAVVAAAQSSSVAASYLAHVMHTLALLCLGTSTDVRTVPAYMDAVSGSGGSSGGSTKVSTVGPPVSVLLAHLRYMTAHGQHELVVPSSATTAAVAADKVTTTAAEAGAATAATASSDDGASSSSYYPFWQPTQPLTAAEYTLLCYTDPTTVEQLLQQYLGYSPPGGGVGARITRASTADAHAHICDALAGCANAASRPHPCVCLAPSYCWQQNEKTRLWRVRYVDLGERARRHEVRRARNAVAGLRASATATSTSDCPCAYHAGMQTWLPVMKMPCGAERELVQPSPDAKGPMQSQQIDGDVATHSDDKDSSVAVVVDASETTTRSERARRVRTTLRVLTWNVMFDRFSNQPTPLGMPGIDWCSPQRYPVLARCIAAEDADVVGMQEVEQPFLTYLAAQPWCRDNYILSCAPDSGVLLPWGVSMLVHRRRLPIVHMMHVNVPAWSGHTSLMPVATLRTPHSGNVHIAVAHLLAPFTQGNTNARPAQDAVLRQRLTRSISGDCIVMGDFNDWPGNEFVMPPEAQFAECWPLLHPHDPGKTMDESNAFCKLKIEEAFFGRSDKVFVRSRRLRPVSAHLVGTRSVNDVNGNTDAPAYLFPSDHYGVSVTFALS